MEVTFGNRESVESIIEKQLNKKENTFKNINNKKIESNFINAYSKKVKEIDLSQKYSLIDFFKILNSGKDLENNIVKLFDVEFDDISRKTIINSIEGRNLVSEKNKLPDYMKRDNQSSIDIKSLGTEIPFSYILRAMNNKCANKVKLQTPELNTITPNKEKPDYILKYNDSQILFDMKGQGLNKNVNINKKAHDRAVSQGLKFYLLGIVNSEEMSSFSSIEYYLLPLNYFLKNCKLITDGKYSSNADNHYYSVKIKDVISIEDLLNSIGK